MVQGSGIGLIVSGLAILGAHFLAGGNPLDLFHLPALLVVLIGTLGATMSSFNWDDLIGAVAGLGGVDEDNPQYVDRVKKEVVALAQISRKEGLLAVENWKEKIKDPMLKKCTQYLIEGVEAPVVREILECESEKFRREEEAASLVFETAARYAPVAGVLGAILALIQVMKSGAESEALMSGVASGFVAAFYGLALSIFVLQPLANKIRRRTESRLLYQAIVSEGVAGILEGISPKILNEKLGSYAQESEAQAS